MKLWYALLGTFLLGAASLSAQTADTAPADTQPVTPITEQAAPATQKLLGYQMYPNAFGFGFISNFSGGLTYQRWFNNGFGFSITAGGSFRSKNNTFNNYAVQLGAQKILSWSEILKGSSEIGIYAAAIAVHQGGRQIQIWKGNSTADNLEFRTGLGLGLGTEFLIFKRVSLTFEALFVGVYPLEVGIDGALGLKFRF